ncbi:MAG: LamG-like jellyroll fold domain-containing protein, partial [Flavobacteriales bacterium]
MSIRHFWFVAFMLISHASFSQLNTGLIAHLPMNGTGADISGNGNNAIPSGGVTPSPNRHMVLSSATYFNGAFESGSLSFATPLFNGRTSFTMSYWFSLNTLSTGMSLVGQDNILETGFYTAPNRIAIFHPNGFLDVMITAPANTWQHLAITTSTTGIAAYLNGVLVGSVNGNYTLGSNTTPTRIGGNVINQNNNSWLNGRIDDVRFYNRVLSPSEIAELAASNGTSVAITSISATNICAGNDITANYSASGLLFSENEFVLQLSNASGSFEFPIDLARITSTSSGAITATIPDGTPSGTGYKLRVVSTALGAASAGSADIAITGIIGNIPNPAQFRYIGKVNNKNFYVGLTVQTWANGSAACIANGGRLATISTVEENILIANNLTNTFAFFGLNDGITEGVFLYPNNEPLTYSNWAQGEPNNASNNEDFGEITASGRWNDLGPASTRLPVLQLNTLSPNVSACVGSDLTLTASSIAGATYTWSGPNGHSGSANTTTINAVNANSAGTYNVLIQQNGCSVSLPAAVALAAFPIGVGESSALLPSLNNGRVLHYPMNGNANDISGNGLNGTTQGGVTNDLNRFDEPSGALRLNGTNGFIDAPDGDYFGNGSFSVSAWLRPVAFNSWSRIMDFGIGQGNQNVLLAATNGTVGRPAIQTYNGTTPSTVVTAPNAITLNQWTHIAFIFENGAGRLYVNGVLVNQGPQLFPQSVVRTLCYIGRSNWAADGFLNGTIDDFRIYNRVLSDAELAS